MRTLSRRREDYVGEWLPEPLLTSPDVAEDVELAESLSIATLTVLETLAPPERAVFVLREVFDVPYGEIAEAVDKSEAAVRQIAHRARRHVAARRPRVEVSRTEQERVLERFLAAFTSGDVQGLMDVLAPDVVMIPDGGGLVQATRQPVTGAKKLASFLTKGMRRLSATVEATTMSLNGAPGARIDIDGALAAAISVDVEGGRITRFYVVLNPEKLEHLDAEAAVSR
jgi:RNA polymerase sigma-70 factor (ECF subfamily)